VILKSPMNTFVTVVMIVLLLTVFSEADALDVRARIGQGGLRDGRAPNGTLGGGQLALDLKLTHCPVFVSFASEYYKKSPEAEQSYEIQVMYVGYLLYNQPLPTTWSSDVYLGGGIGVLRVPKSQGDNSTMERAIGFDAVCGISAKAFWKIGVYIEGKYIYSRKTRGSIRTVDFNDFGALIGLSLDFGWWNS
jgi:hypothetical protein